MGRKKKLTDEQIISGTEQYFHDICEGNVKLLTYKKIAGYLSNLYGIMVADYDLKKNARLIQYVKFIKNEEKNQVLHSNICFQRLNVDDFLRKNNSPVKLKKALVNLDSYYAKYSSAIGDIIEENRKLHTDILSQKHKLHELEIQIQELEDLRPLEKELKKQVSKLKGILHNYVYPELANKLLAESGFLKDIPDIISPDGMAHIVSVKDNISKKIQGFENTVQNNHGEETFSVDHFVDDLYV